jgi:hypothetical protein
MVQHQEERDLVLVQQFFAARELMAERIPETTVKTTDFKILRNSELVAFCEVKSPQDVFAGRVKDAIIEVPGGQCGGVIESGPVSRQYRCMERAAKKAVAQFNSVNASHAVPNILMIVNHDAFSYEGDFVEAVTGYIEGLGYAAKGVRDEIPEIDAYVWLSSAATPEERIFWKQNCFRDTVIDLLQPDELIPGRREARARVVAAGLSDDDIDRLIKQAQAEAQPLLR